MGAALGAGLLLLWLLGKKAGGPQRDVPSNTNTDKEPDWYRRDTGGGGGGGLVTAIVTGAGLVIKGVASATAPTGAAVAAGTATAVAGGGAVGVVTVALLANPIAWAVYILIGTIISKHQSESKNFELGVGRLSANARSMHEYERGLWYEFQANTARQYVTSQVRDRRLDYEFNHQGSRVTFRGYRTVVRDTGAPPPIPASVPYDQRRAYLLSQGTLVGQDLDTMFRRIRAAALVYLAERARLGVAISASKLGRPNPVQGFLLDDFALTQQYEAIEARLGGLSQVPTLGGATLEPRSVSDEELFPPVDQLIGRNTEPNTADLTLADIQSARLAALLDAVTLFKHDLTIDLRGAGDWADALWGWLGSPSGISRSGRSWTLDPEIYGAAYVIDVWAAKTGVGRVLGAP